MNTNCNICNDPCYGHISPFLLSPKCEEKLIININNESCCPRPLDVVSVDRNCSQSIPTILSFSSNSMNNMLNESVQNLQQDPIALDEVPVVAGIGLNDIVQGVVDVPKSLPALAGPGYGGGNVPPSSLGYEQGCEHNEPQLTPEYTRVNGPSGAQQIRDQTQLSQSVVTSQDPDGISWLSPAQWNAATWNGIPLNPCGKTIAEICSFVFPSANTMRGLREHFYAIKPFCDNKNPTVSEIERWNVEVVRHFRALLGINTPVNLSRERMLTARWADERKYTTVWDTDYPTNTCGPSSQAHCGMTFVPSAEHQQPYLNGGSPVGGWAGAEGLATTNADLPWSIKLGRVIAQYLCSEGLGGHTGPFIGRTEFGYSFYRYSQQSVIFRGQWSGDLVNPCP